MSIPEKPPVKAVPVAIQLRHIRLALMVFVFTAILLSLMVPFAGKGVVLYSFLSSQYSKDEQATMRDDYNSWSSGIVSAINLPTGWLINFMMPVCFLALVSNYHVQCKRKFEIVVTFMTIDTFIKYLINNGFQAVNVQISAQQLRANIATMDLKVSTDALDIMLGFTTNVTHLITEDGLNYMTNTVLRNVLAPIALKATASVCLRRDDAYDTSQYSTGMVQSYGFPVREWQNTMLPTNLFVHGDSYQLLLGNNATELAGERLNMSVKTAANLFIHAIHVSQFFFRWINTSSLPFNIIELIQENQKPDFMFEGDESSAPSHSITAATLLNLLPPASSRDDEESWFLTAARDLFKKSLSSGVNISQDEANITFWHGGVKATDNIQFDAVTFEVPLRRNFYYRKLILSTDGQELAEDKTATAFYTNISHAANNSDIYYDLDMSADCGPNPGLCVMPRVQEYDFYGNKYQPDPQIKATAVCLNDNGTEDFQIDYKYYSIDGNASQTYVDAAWACKNKSSTSMYIVSFGSRVVGDAMYDSPAPDATITPIDGNRSTIVNPRKIYFMTVVRLAWELTDLAQNFNATCLIGSDNCYGLNYLMDLSVKDTLSSASNATHNQFIVVGEDSIPINYLSPFSYNDTETFGSYNGFGTATRWVSLMTLASPAEDTAYSQKGDLLFSHNFRSFNWRSGRHRGHNCSDSAEDYLNHMVNNHYYMGHGLQAAYTAGMYFLFQNGKVRDIVGLTSDGSEWTLAFEGNEQWMDVAVVIPIKSLVVTCSGIVFILLGSTAAVIFSRCGRRSLLKHPEHVTIEMVADMMLNDSKYPPLLLERRFDTVGLRGIFQHFQIAGLDLHDEKNGSTHTLTLDATPEQHSVTVSPVEVQIDIIDPDSPVKSKYYY